MTILTADELIDALGGNRPLGERLGVRENTVSTWRVRGIPAWVRDDFRALAEQASLDCDPAIFGVRRRAGSARAAA